MDPMGFACHDDWRPVVYLAGPFVWSFCGYPEKEINLQSDEPLRTVESVNLHDFCGWRFIKYILNIDFSLKPT